jgi:hypothetical protein
MATTKKNDVPMREEILDFVRKTEDTVADAGRKLSEAVRDLVPGDGQGIRRVVDEAFDFAETILRSQRDLASSLLDDVLGEPSPKRTPGKRTPGKRTPAKRTPAKRTTAKPTAKRVPRKTTKRTSAA